MSYSPPKYSNWTGRKTDATKRKQYWYQHVEIEKLSSFNDADAPEIGLLGYVCDEGVKRNQGRTGAKEGPAAIRQKAGKVALHSSKRIADFGDIVCDGADMEACQKELAQAVSKLLKTGIFPILLGGGHDIAYGHFKGIKEAVGDKQVGIINFDAHFDLRPVDDKPNSGTPFNQILSEFGDKTDYMAIGIQRPANTSELFQIADEHMVTTIPIEDCQLFNLENVLSLISLFMAKQDVLYVTVDLDGFSSAYAPGVSAPSAVGFAPDFFFKVLDEVLKSKKVISLDIAELSPKYDQDGVTAGLAARIIAATV